MSSFFVAWGLVKATRLCQSAINICTQARHTVKITVKKSKDILAIHHCQATLYYDAEEKLLCKKKKKQKRYIFLALPIDVRVPPKMSSKHLVTISHFFLSAVFFCLMESN